MLTDVSVYVHFPWCLRKCPYCDFVSYRSEKDEIEHEAYSDAVLRELELRLADVRKRKLVSVFFGGGTPSLWEPVALERVVKGIHSAFSANIGDVEVTAECNPSSLDEARAAALVQAGVNRLSVGVQALREHHLHYLGRSHTPERALASLRYAMKHARQASADFIFGLPTQVVSEWRDDLQRVVDTGVKHVSAYALTIEAKTAFGERYRKGQLPIASDDAYADLYLATEDVLCVAGFEHYEVSNYSREQNYALHNLHYWRSGDYLGLGVGAVGALTRTPGTARRYRNTVDTRDYLAANDLLTFEGESEVLSARELVCEGLMLGLRTRAGMNAQTVNTRAARVPMVTRERAVARAVDRGELVIGEEYWRVPQDKWLHLDGIVASLF